MIDHAGLEVSDLKNSTRFYQLALAPLGYQLRFEFEGYSGFSQDGKTDFWLHQSSNPNSGVHIAFSSSDRSGVDEYYKAAISAGGTDNGKPGLRKKYHPNYYGAFIFDPDGNNIEAVCHRSE